MRNRNSYKIFVLFALVLFLGVGYAVVNSVSLTITGTSSAGTSDLKVAFNGTKTISNTNKGTASVTDGSRTATFTASNMSLNEIITFSYDIKNSEVDVDTNVTMSVTNSNSNYFSVGITEYSSNSTSFFVGAGETTKIYVVVKMIKTPITTADSSATFNVTINASPVDLITFYTSGVSMGTYYAEPGMTWKDWTSSKYGDKSGFGTSSYEVTYATSYVTDNYINVKPTDVIKDGYTYYLVQD